MPWPDKLNWKEPRKENQEKSEEEKELQETIDELENLIAENNSAVSDSSSDIPVLDEVVGPEDFYEEDHSPGDTDFMAQKPGEGEQEIITDAQITDLLDKVEEKISDELDDLVDILKDTIKDSILTELKTELKNEFSHPAANDKDVKY